MRSVKDADIRGGMSVLVRGDLDAPLVDGKILDAYRLDSLLPTLGYIVKRGAGVILMGHIGNPSGNYVRNLSTEHLKDYFEARFEKQVSLLENLRFDKREEKNDPEFAKELAAFGGIYVNECFAVSHRRHASVVGVPGFLPSYAGLRLMEEVETLKDVLIHPKRPFVVVIGGAKLETKMPVVERLLELADFVLLGGRVGLEWDGKRPPSLRLPSDYVDGDKDIGPETASAYSKILLKAGCVVWSGPMGIYEDAKYARGTTSAAEAIVESKAYSIIGGGDTIAAARGAGLLEKFGFVSVGGGAMLEFLAKGTLPGLEALA